MVTAVDHSNILSELELIASDMDGTLLNGSNTIGEQVIAAYNHLGNQTKIPFVLATGRTRLSALNKLAARGLDWSKNCGIFQNGAVVHGPGGVLVHETKFTMEEVEAIISTFANDMEKAVILLCCGDEVHAPQLCEIGLFLHKDYADTYPINHGSYAKMLQHIKDNNLSVHLISISTANCRIAEAEVYERTKAAVTQFGTLEEYSVVTPIPRLVVMIPKNTSKGAGLAALCKVLDICPSKVAAIGDANNDIEMLQVAGFPVAMGNATADLKARAKLVVNRNDHPELPGVAQLIHLVIDSQTNNSKTTTSD